MLLSRTLLKAAALAVVVAAGPTATESPSESPTDLPSVSPSASPSTSSVPSSSPSSSPSDSPTATAGPTTFLRPSMVPSASPSDAPTTVERPSMNPSRAATMEFQNNCTVASQGSVLSDDVEKCNSMVDNIRTGALELAQQGDLLGTVQAELSRCVETTTDNGVNNNETNTVVKAPCCQLPLGTRSTGANTFTTFVIEIKQYFGISDDSAQQEVFQQQASAFGAVVNLASLQPVLESPDNLALAGTNFELGKLEQSADAFPGQVLSVSVSPTKSSSPSASPSMAPSGSPSVTASEAPSASPSAVPTKAPTKNPTNPPTNAPTRPPTNFPTKSPTMSPTGVPSDAPSCGGKSCKSAKSVKTGKSVKTAKSTKSTNGTKSAKGTKKGRRGRGKLLD